MSSDTFSFSYMGLGMIFFMVFLMYCFASLDDKKEQEMSVSVVISTSAFYLMMLYSFLASLTLKYSGSILDDINKGETSSSDYYSMEKPSYNSQPARHYTQPAVSTYTQPAVPKTDVPVRQFSDEYVKDFDEGSKPAAAVRQYSDDNDYVRDFDDEDEGLP